MSDLDVWDVIQLTVRNLYREYADLLFDGDCHKPENHGWHGADAQGCATPKGVWATTSNPHASSPDATWAQIRKELVARLDFKPMLALRAQERTAYAEYCAAAHEYSLGYIDGTVTDEQRERDRRAVAEHIRLDRALAAALVAAVAAAPSGVPDALGTPSMLDLLEVTA
jgi:hypothetical protein